ncbi:short-chain dehydrogenase [Colletotrichum truncatum]|uniref:Short-chain dehydrogenase n=1 Tax=Colletotrichum truncatum TaxID=5467 RepID=A0ACC3ZFQ3_COLTU|nr:short-chain dehydrogenase [Colletotrichum truncatum]KAF6801830.1 short-chain dehydrogenase [Colletotrichum truncatum]
MASNKTYLITGANRGIGKGFTSLLLQRPSTTVIAGVRDLSNDSSQALTSLPKADGSKLILVKIDSSVESDPSTAVSQLQKEHGITSLDVVIANAGISHSSSQVREVPVEASLEHFKVNSIAPLLLFGAAAPLLKNSESPIFVAVSSVIGSNGAQEMLNQGFPGASLAPYGASKAALNWLVRRLHFEEPWLTSFVFHPGLVETDMSAKMGSDLKAAGAISVKQSVDGMVATIDGATKATSGTFKNHDGSDLPW